MKIEKATWDDFGEGGSVGWMKTDYAYLVEKLGEPQTPTVDPKTDVEWVRKIDGHVVVISNYKSGHSWLGPEGKDIEDVTVWLVAAEEGRREVLPLLHDLLPKASVLPKIFGREEMEEPTTTKGEEVSDECVATMQAATELIGERCGRRFAKDYQGYTNYETWAVKLWIDNERETQEFWRKKTREILKDAAELQRKEHKEWTVDETAKFTLEDELREWFEEHKPETDDTVFADLLTASINTVNFQEIAEELINDVKEEG